jgi:hypothetical protein
LEGIKFKIYKKNGKNRILTGPGGLTGLRGKFLNFEIFGGSQVGGYGQADRRVRLGGYMGFTRRVGGYGYDGFFLKNC